CRLKRCEWGGRAQSDSLVPSTPAIFNRVSCQSAYVWPVEGIAHLIRPFVFAPRTTDAAVLGLENDTLSAKTRVSGSAPSTSLPSSINASRALRPLDHDSTP